jgi:multimeric flavodoxin WrbA
MPSPEIRKGMPPVKLDREEFEKRFKSRFVDPAFEPLEKELQAITGAAWDAYADSRKAPHTRKAGPGFADPDYDLSVDWLAARDAIAQAQRGYEDPAAPARILLINASARSEHTCPGEMSKTWRLIELAQRTIEDRGAFHTDVLDLSRTASEFGRTIHPCKSCVATSMALCHWPCSCYPNYALGQTHDWMNDIYPLWVAAHGIMIITPVHWYQAPGPLKVMMDRLVCADGGNPDPTSTHGKHPDEAKALELAGWPYPRHLAGRIFSVVVHGDTEGAEPLRDSLIDWAQDMRLIPAGSNAELDRYVGYYEPYATSHEALDRDQAFQEEVRNVAFTLMEAVIAKREGRLMTAGSKLKEPRPK